MILTLLIASATCYGPSDCRAPKVCSSVKTGTIPGVCMMMTKEPVSSGPVPIKPKPKTPVQSTTTPPVPAPPAAAPAFSPPLPPPMPDEFKIDPPDGSTIKIDIDDFEFEDGDEDLKEKILEMIEDEKEEKKGPVARVVSTIIINPVKTIIESVKDFWCLLFGCN